jgi:flagellin-specific chaperone FliS
VAQGDITTVQDLAVIPGARQPSDAMSVETTKPPDVCLAFRLGWDVADHFRELETLAATGDMRTVSAGLPMAGRLDGIDTACAGALRVRADFVALQMESRVQAAGLTAPDLGNLTAPAQLRTGAPDVAAAQVRKLHIDLLITLMAVAPTMGKAYDLGASLATFCAPKAVPPEKFDPDNEELLRLHDLVRELTSVLPPHAGHGVSESMAQWHAYLSQGLHKRGLLRHRSPDDEKQALIVRQGLAWRAVLSAEKKPADNLGVTDVIDVGLSALDRGRKVLFKAGYAIWPCLLALVAAAALVLFITVKGASGTTESATALTTVAATLAAGWRAVKTPLVGAFSDLERRLRDAGLDAAIADSITVLPSDAAESRVNKAIEQVAKVSAEDSRPAKAATQTTGS